MEDATDPDNVIYKVQYVYYYLSKVDASADIDDYTKDTYTEALFTEVVMPTFLEKSFFDQEFDINMIGDGLQYIGIADKWTETEADTTTNNTTDLMRAAKLEDIKNYFTAEFK